MLNSKNDNKNIDTEFIAHGAFLELPSPGIHKFKRLDS
jgi:hypothetical protein